MSTLSDILDRFRRRKIVQWAVAYLAAAWLVMQLVEVLGGRWSWPIWIQRLIDLLLVVGFLAVLVLAWYHGEQGRQRVSGPELVMIAALLAIAGFQFVLVRPDSTGPTDGTTDQGEVGGVPGTSSEPATSSGYARLDLALPDTAPMVFVGEAPLGIGRQSMTLSRSGDVIVYVAASRDGRTVLCRRDLSRFDVACLSGTEGAVAPFLSRDGQTVAFFAQGVLYTMPTSGGDPSPVAEVPNAVGGTWRGDSVVWSGQEGTAVRIVSTIDGTGRGIPVDGPNVRSAPTMLPGGQMLYSNEATVYAADARAGTTRVLLRNAQSPRFRPPSSLYFIRGADLMRVPFDAARIRIDGQPALVASGVRVESQGSGQYGVADDGTIVFAPGGASAAGRLHWVNHDGSRDPLPFEPAVLRHFRMSPDGERIAAAVRESSWDIWVFEPEAGTRRRITSAGDNMKPVWSRDGDRVCYVSREASTGAHIACERPESVGQPLIVHRSSALHEPLDVVAGDSILTIRTTPDGDPRLALLPLQENADIRLVRPGPSTTLQRISPDGRWLAFTSDRLGRYEVYVTPLAGEGSRQLSSSGGEEPVWAPDGRNLYYRNGHDLMRVRLAEDDDGLRAESTTRVWTMLGWINTPGHSYDITPDGERFLVLHRPPRTGTDHLRVIRPDR